jgi:pimeloyl-ACP methyl ester carboxylesterase
VSDAESVDTAIVYVHGFLGDAQTTWEQLQYYVDRLRDEPFKNSDLHFFEYPAEDQFVLASVARLRSFLTQIYPLPPSALVEAHLRDFDWRLPGDSDTVFLRELHPYSRLILVGHSLGAVVIRRFIADEAISQAGARKSGRDVAPSRFLDAELTLMAPAHIGFQPTGTKALLHALAFPASLARYAAVFRAFSDLKPDCFTLAQLQRETVEMAALFPASTAFKPRVLWGEQEDVVLVGRFDSDPPEAVQQAPGKNHVTVCKLTKNYEMPADVVIRGRAVGRGA